MESIMETAKKQIDELLAAKDTVIVVNANIKVSHLAVKRS